MRIVVLDGHTLNPGDLSWRELEALGECAVYERTAPGQVLEHARGAGILLTNKTVLSRETIFQLPDLRYIGVLATGYNVVDVDAARQRGIPVCNVPDYATAAVAQMTFALLLELTQHVAHHAQTVRDGRWSNSADFCYWDHPPVELHGLTMGVVGLGRIGRAVAGIAGAFGMRVLAFSPSVRSVQAVAMTDLETLLRTGDIISLHCPLTADNEKLINAERLRLMKPTAYLVNTARGGLIDEQALADALDHDRLAGAGLDVMAMEPPPAGNPLFTVKNCVITPHIAWATAAARKRLLKTAAENIRCFLSGNARNTVEP